MKNIIFILIFLFSIFSFQVFPQDFEDDTFPEDLENVVPELDTLVEEGEKKEKQKGQNEIQDPFKQENSTNLDEKQVPKEDVEQRIAGIMKDMDKILGEIQDTLKPQENIDNNQKPDKKNENKKDENPKVEKKEKKEEALPSNSSHRFHYDPEPEWEGEYITEVEGL
ncbi:MAG: hypothetical protein H7A25_19780 [Leptospiraceae bacterium]|nr:hypothetical protein [Leptospiraceae bacterium]MCP5502148.1 hypothetical protein [Leptospiraceae bacterium]